MPYESEWHTRKKHIDFRLKKLGRKIVPFSTALDLGALHIAAGDELPTANGPADDGLFVGGHLLAVVEAKKVTADAQNVLKQAKRYAAGVFAAVGERDGLRVPFLYASNGTLVWYLDTCPFTTEERVQAGIAELRAFHTYTPEQEQWLALIAWCLVENLSVGTSDLEAQPVLSSKGGFGSARKVFGNQLRPLNYTLAA